MPYSVKTNTFQLTVGNITDQQQVAMPDSRRVSIVFNFGITTASYVSNRQMASEQDSLFATTSTLPIILLYKDHAELVRGEFWAWGLTGFSFVTVTEVLYMP